MSSGLPRTVVCSVALQRHDQHVLRMEEDESFQNHKADAEAREDQATLQWLEKNKHLWEKR